MMKYKASDIIKMALSLADLSNSSFITFGDNIKFLNDAYTKLYQKMIDANDKYFLKKFTINGSISGSSMESVYDLPADFYQLYGIQIVPTCIPILRKSKNEPNNSQRYDIVNGKLILYGNISDNIEVSYFPLPRTISYSAESFGTQLSATSYNVISCYDKEAFISLPSSYAIINLDTLVQTVVPTSISSGVLGKYFILTDGSGGDSINIFDRIHNTNNTLARSNYSLYTYRLDDEPALFAYNGTSNTFGIFTMVGYTLSDTPMVLDLNLDNFSYASSGGISDGTTALINGTDGIYFINSSSSTNILSGESININKSASLNGIYYFYTNKCRLYSFDGVYLNKISDIAVLGGINKASIDTGYGYIYRDIDAYYEGSIFGDTVLSYPENSLYTLLAYYLAILYCTKQNKDTTLLESAAYNQETQYFGMIDNDVNMNYRITNINTSVGM